MRELVALSLPAAAQHVVPGHRYEGRGLFLEPPSVGLSKGAWHVRLAAALDGVAGPLDLQFPTRDAVFSASRCLADPLNPKP